MNLQSNLDRFHVLFYQQNFRRSVNTWFYPFKLYWNRSNGTDLNRKFLTVGHQKLQLFCYISAVRGLKFSGLDIRRAG